MTNTQLMKIQIDSDMNILENDLRAGLYEGRFEDFVAEYNKILLKLSKMIDMVSKGYNYRYNPYREDFNEVE